MLHLRSLHLASEPWLFQEVYIRRLPCMHRFRTDHCPERYPRIQSEFLFLRSYLCCTRQMFLRCCDEAVLQMLLLQLLLLTVVPVLRSVGSLFRILPRTEVHLCPGSLDGLILLPDSGFSSLSDRLFWKVGCPLSLQAHQALR